jgi:hypothetical protein
MINAGKTWIGKLERKRLLVRLWHRQESSIQKDFKEIGCEGVDWIHVA